MAINIKAGVFGQLHDVMRPALNAVQQVWRLHGRTPTITSIEDGQHIPTSKHYQGLAFDVRLNDIDNALHERLVREVSGLISSRGFDVIHEYHDTPRDHLHIEFDPK